MARTDGVWMIISGVVRPIGPNGYDVLIYGTDRYLNFNLLSGSSGYGFRDNGGVMEYKNSGGDWAGIGSGGGGSKQHRVTIPGEQVADTSNYQGLYLYNDTGATITISNVAVVVGRAAAGTGAAYSVNVYKSSGTAADGLNTNAVALFSSAIALTTSYTSLTNTPNTTTVESGRWLTVRVTASAGATNKAADAQIIITYT